MKRQVLLWWLCAIAARAQVITTVAGTNYVVPATGIKATDAPLGSADAVAVDGAGNLYVTDTFDQIVVRVSPKGTLTVVAGNGNAGFSGDGGPATSASLNLPLGLAVDANGNLYIADSNNNRIRKVANGIITTIAGTGGPGFADGAAPKALFDLPRGITLDAAGSLYIADAGNNRIRKLSNGAVTTIAGNGTASFSGDGGPATSAAINFPTSVAVDTSGAIYIIDSDNYRARKVSGGIITTIAGNGQPGISVDGTPATGPLLPYSVAVDANGTIYIGECCGYGVKKVSGGIANTVPGTGSNAASVGSGAAGRAPDFMGLAVDSSGSLYMADAANGRVQKFAGGTLTTIAGSGSVGDGGPASAASLSPFDVAVDGNGNLYIVDAHSNRIRKVSKGVITTIAGNGSFGATGDLGPATSASIDPFGVAIDSAGNVYIADGAGLVRKVSQGIITTVAGNGRVTYAGDNGPAISASLNLPTRVAVERVTYTLRIRVTIESERCLVEPSLPSPEADPRAQVAITGQQPVLNSCFQWGWLWITPAICTLPIVMATAYGKYRRA
jgi:sugar lactone lactonase YvrE